MGNVHSAEAPRRVTPASNKLVKARMATAAAAALASANARQQSRDDALPSSPGAAGERRFSFSHPFGLPPVSPSVPFPALDVDLPLQPDPLDDDPDNAKASMVAKPVKKERSLRRIFRSRSSSRTQSKCRGSPERRNTTTAADLPPLPPLEGQGVAPPTRRNSMLGASDAVYHDRSTRESWNIADSRVSWNYNLTSYEAKRLLNLVQGDTTGIQDEISAAATENKFSVVSEVTWKSSHPPLAESTVGAAISRANSDLSLCTPVRRRSIIQTPGLATRRSASKGPPLSSQRYSHPPTPNLSRQCSFDSVGSRALSMPPLPPRMKIPDEIRGPVTPCEGDYQTIGAFKLGTLRIVNGNASPGAVSPEPDEKRRVKQPDVPSPTRKESSYFTPAPSVGSQRARTGIRRDVDLTIRTDAPISPPNAPTVVIHTGRLRRSPTATVVKSPVAASSLSPSLLQVRSSEGEKGASGQSLSQIQSSAFSMAGGSPYSPLVTTSKANELEDNLFDDDAQPEYATPEILDLRLDPHAKSEPTAVSLNAARQGALADDGSGSINPTAELSHKPLTKTDSGYCSNVSLRSLRSSSRPPLPDGDVSWGSSEGRRTSLSSPLGNGSSEDQRPSGIMFPSAPRREPPPPPPPKDFPNSSPAGVSGTQTVSQPPTLDGKSRAGANTTLDKATRRASASAATARTRAVASRSSPDLAVISPSSIGSAGSASKLSSGSGSGGSQKGGRFHRLLNRGSSGRSQDASPPQAMHVSKRASSASASREGHRKLKTHSGQFKTKARKLDLKSQASKDTLKTIMSVGSMEARAVEAAQNGETTLDSPGKNRRHTSYTPSALGQVASADGDEQTPTKPSRSLSIPRKPLPVPKDSNTTAVDTAPAYLAPTGKSIARSSSRSPVMITRSPSKIFDKDYRDELHFSPTVTEISIISPVAVPPPTEDDQPLPPSPAAPEPVSRKRVGATPPPVSMRTRNQGSLRVPAPLRLKSTSPTRAQSLVLPRTAGQEQHVGHESVRRQDVLQVLTVASGDVLQAPLSAPMQPRRSMTLEVKRSPSFSRVPDWQVRTDHDTSRRSSLDVRPGDPFQALEMVAAEQGHKIRRPSSAQPAAHVVAQGQVPQLRHRASYDDRTRRHMSYLPPQQQQQQRPAMPSTDPRWYRQLSDAYGQPQQYRSWQAPQQQQQQHLWGRQQQQQQQQQWNQWHEQQKCWDQQQQGTHSRPYATRGGHGRNNSLGSSDGQGQSGAPYRVLHSYNSPAYRHAPIWG
ncbi:hypothetical protein MAPG_02416 [Magnaporthiopsis poae ATCC 64411]|uniref:Proteophosphoglycan ppg4 n=1 Tax=Magnaporthiopsis poae (strain ATCC 64411 / 73-15) TaxID=644358 RepID=A0A0C4DRA8_MAGP6|nr:hypothetical protein MAPG_02416 [Magnaporthiopsis poae ATCC 64411]